MKLLKEYEAMTISGQESFLAHASADLVQKMYYENNREGLEVIIKNLTVIIARAKDCLGCLDMLRQEGDVYAKIYLLLEYMGKGGISEEFVSGLEELTELTQETLELRAKLTMLNEDTIKMEASPDFDRIFWETSGIFTKGTREE